MSKTKALRAIQVIVDEELEMEEFEGFCSGLKIAELAELQREAKKKLDEIKKIQSDTQKIFDKLRLHLIPEKMDDMGCSSIKLDGIGRLTISGDLYAGINSERKTEALQWMEDNGFGDLVKPSVHNSTLKAWIKEQIQKGEELPDDLFTVTPFERASITKA